MINQQPSFQEHMKSLNKAENESLQEVLQNLLKQKIIPNESDLNVLETIIDLSNRTRELSSRVQVTSDLTLKLDLISAQIVLMNAMSLITAATMTDTKADTRRINALLYLR